MPLRHRCGYAADLPRSLPTGDINPAQESPAIQHGRAPLPSPDPPGSSW
jgi:hypothetical protein